MEKHLEIRVLQDGQLRYRYRDGSRFESVAVMHHLPEPYMGAAALERLKLQEQGYTLCDAAEIEKAPHVADMAYKGMGLPVRADVETVGYHRNPTAGEIRFGHGATHYREFTVEECCWPGSRFAKKKLLAPDDGLWYYR